MTEAPSTPDLASRILEAIERKEQMLRLVLSRPRAALKVSLRNDVRRCELDRGLVERHHPDTPQEGRLPWFCAHCGWRWPCPDVRDLAEVYGVTAEEQGSRP